MVQHHDYIFFFQDKSRLFWGLDTNGDVSINSNPYPLTFSPDGWIDTTIENIRNKKYWAIDRTVSAPFKYVEDGAKILKHIFYKKGVEESVYLVICSLQLVYTPGVEYGYWYKQIFRSEVDLSTFNHAGAYVTCSNSEEGLAKHLKANENTIYEINLSNGINIKEDGIILKQKINFLIPAGVGFDDQLVATVETTREGSSTGAASFTVFMQDEPGDLTTSQEYFFKTVVPITGITLSGKLKCGVLAVGGGTFYLRLKSNLGRNDVLFSQAFGGPALGVDTTFSYIFDGAENENFFLVADIPSALPPPSITFQETNLAIEFKSIYQATYIKARLPQFVFSELINKMTDGEYSAEDCPYFGDLFYSNVVFTSGDAIRGLPDAVLKISFSQFFGFWNTFDEVGIRDLTKKVLFDRKNNLIDKINIIDLGEVSKPVITFDKELPFNELAIGYPDIKNENGFVNGKNEFNTTFTYSLGTTKTPRKYEKISAVRASCYDIENTRIEQANKTTTDNKSDNEPYCLHIERTLQPAGIDFPDHYLLDRSLNPFLGGVDEKETIFNVIFSPKRCFRRSSDFLHSCQYLADNKIFKFITADRNKDMAYINGADVVVENADEPVGSLDPKFLNPVVINIDVMADENLLDDLELNPIKTFSFTFNGDEYKGISIKNSINPKRNKMQTYQLWPFAETNLEPLIDFYGG